MTDEFETNDGSPFGRETPLQVFIPRQLLVEVLRTNLENTQRNLADPATAATLHKFAVHHIAHLEDCIEWLELDPRDEKFCTIATQSEFEEEDD